MYALSPRASSIHIRQSKSVHVTTNVTFLALLIIISAKILSALAHSTYILMYVRMYACNTSHAWADQ